MELLWGLIETIPVKCLIGEHSKHQVNDSHYDFSYSRFKFFSILNFGLLVLLTVEKSWKTMFGFIFLIIETWTSNENKWHKRN